MIRYGRFGLGSFTLPRILQIIKPTSLGHSSLAYLLGFWMLLGGMTTSSLAWAETTLNAGVQLDVTAPVGSVISAHSGRPIGEAVVSIPELGIQFKSDPLGHFELPPLPNKPVIVHVEAPGYVAETRTLRGNPNSPYRFRLVESRQTLVIDDTLRHLGDNNYSANSAAAGQFRVSGAGPVLTLPFYLPPTAGQLAILQIGSVIGLDTAKAQSLGQSQLAYSSSPGIVKLNGVQVAVLSINGDRLRVRVPQGVLRPGAMNQVEIQAGYHTPGGTRIDFDDFELMSVFLEAQSQ
jgi:hypothetical protein